MKTGIVICSRTDSERLPNKPFKKINGGAIINLLIENLQKTELPIILAVPCKQLAEFKDEMRYNNVLFYDGYADDPLARMSAAADLYKLDAVIRITHDKFMIRYKDILNAVKQFEQDGADYMFGSKFIPGTGFEIIKSSLLKQAAAKYKNVEFIGYAARSLAKNIVEFKPRHPVGDYRLLIDYPSDVQLFDVILSQLGNDATLEDTIIYLNTHPELKLINRLPKLTVYTCAYNSEQWIDQCMKSVERQRIFHDIEYIIIDDHSNDKTTEIIAKFASHYPNVKWIRNETNLGLASSSNIALKMARGDYVLRLDADDYFVSLTAIEELLLKITSSGDEIVYPDNYFGDFNKIQDGSKNHHIGCAIFDKRAVNHIKFTDGLRNYEGLDLWARAQKQLKIGYLKRPMFFYHQHSKSMSKTNLREREKIKEKILSSHYDLPLVEDYA